MAAAESGPRPNRPGRDLAAMNPAVDMALAAATADADAYRIPGTARLEQWHHHDLTRQPFPWTHACSLVVASPSRSPS